MKFPTMVKYKGKYYSAGSKVPVLEDDKQEMTLKGGTGQVQKRPSVQLEETDTLTSTTTRGRKKGS